MIKCAKCQTEFEKGKEICTKCGTSYVATACYILEGTEKSSEQEVKDVLEWFHITAENGNPDVQAFLGWFYRDGEIIEQNISKAIKWLTLSAEQDYVYAQYSLGMLLKDNGDIDGAKKWLKLAADQGYPSATTALENL